MMVSEREMCLSEDHNGIIDLLEDIAIGTPLAEIYGLNDPVIEINVTPNRPDCAGIRGIARDLAAVGLGTLKPLPTQKLKGSSLRKPNVTLHFDDANKEVCPLFMGRLIMGIKTVNHQNGFNKIKSHWSAPDLDLVDITNYFCIGLSRPLHVFDADKFSGDIQIRLSKKEKHSMLSMINPIRWKMG